MILGIWQRDIWEWISKGLLPVTKINRATLISDDDLAKFLADHPIYVGRIYCEDELPYHNQIRKQIVEKMETIRDANYTTSNCRMHTN